MLDELLGRAELKGRIAELEEEKHHLQRQLEAESERRADAVSDRQAAEQRANRLEDRIAELEDRVARSERDGESTRGPRGTETLGGERLASVCERLRSIDAGPEGALTAVVPDEGPLAEPVAEAAGETAAAIRSAAPVIYYTDDAGVVSAGLRPPIFPTEFVAWDDTFRVDPAWVRPVGRLVFGVVRADRCAVGVYDDGSRVAFEGFESDVKSDHSKGGFSQGRFERIRDQQIDEHLEKSASTLEALIDEYDPERVVLTGGREALAELAELADHTARTDAGGPPEAAIEDAFRDFWTTRLVTF